MRYAQRTILAWFSLSLVVSVGQASAAEQELTWAEMYTELAQRDAAIIKLQHTVRDLVARLETVERSINPGRRPQSPPLQLTNTPQTTAPRGFGKLEVDEQAAQRALERTLIQGGALLLPAWRMQIGPSLAYSLNQFDLPALVADGESLLLGSSYVERSTFSANLDLRLGLPFDSQLELGLPYRWADEEIGIRLPQAPFGQTMDRSGSGTGNLRVGLAKTLLRERGWRPDVIGRITWDTGSGHRTDNGVILNGIEAVGGSLTFIKRYDPLVFFGSMHYQTFLADDKLEPGDQFALSFGTALAVSPTNSLFASISNQYIDAVTFGDERIDGSDITSITLNFGASTIVSRGLLLNLTAGIGISEDAPDYMLGLSASIQTDALRNFMFRQGSE